MPSPDEQTGSKGWLPSGVGPSLARNHNERLVLSTIQRSGPMAGAEIARRTGLSAQTASVIMRSLKADGLLRRGEPKRGKVGKPQMPMRLAPDGILSIGLRIGRRSADMVLIDFVGAVRRRFTISYGFPTPDQISKLVADNLGQIQRELATDAWARISGIGVGLPYGIWEWLDVVDAPPKELEAWKNVSLADRFAVFTDLPVHVGNDATLACNGEMVFGLRHTVPDFAYFHVGTFVGGGLVLGGRIHAGPSGNAAAFGSLPVGDDSVSIRPQQLLEDASLYVLERALVRRGMDTKLLWDRSADWTVCEPDLTAWLGRIASSLASACVTVTAVTDVPLIVIDGNMPEPVRTRLVGCIATILESRPAPGIRKPLVQAGHLGPMAGAMGAAYQPIAQAVLYEGNRM